MLLKTREIDKLLAGQSCINIKDNDKNTIIEVYDNQCYFIYDELLFLKISKAKDLKKISIAASEFIKKCNDCKIVKENKKAILIFNTNCKHFNLLAEMYYEIKRDIDLKQIA